MYGCFTNIAIPFGESRCSAARLAHPDESGGSGNCLQKKKIDVYSVYIIESKSGRWYYGSSDDVVQRLKEHNSNRSLYTRFKGPWELIFQRDFETKTEGLRFEKLLKKTRNKEFIQREYKEFFLR
ncbi:MAG: GIY-YIG nuclease family protein [Imperialibacter sp.]|uniref:GIY-YIG nuclease family protein n=1 Tax=Imperialibacter sp. TaxID=2038411 RepID=UPI003A85A1C8